MNRILLVACALIAPCWVCFGQTNAPAAAPSLPRPALKSPAQPGQDSPAIALPAGANSPAGRMSLEGSRAKTAASDRVEQDGLLKPAGPTYTNDFERNMAAAFKPEIVQRGHTQIYSSVVTAVARKNPLCLLDPTFLNISF
jgi:hypothetical protein